MEKYQFAQCQLSVGRGTGMTKNRNVSLSIKEDKALYIVAWIRAEDGLLLLDSYESHKSKASCC